MQNIDIKEILGTFLEYIQFHKIPANVLMREIHPLNLVPYAIIMNALAYQVGCVLNRPFAVGCFAVYITQYHSCRIICLSIYPSTYLSICLSICLSMRYLTICRPSPMLSILLSPFMSDSTNCRQTQKASTPENCLPTLAE